ncbi:hypothetical protein [Pelagibacterium limicola]|uniref:hypothetical protein n=1 Tax=Pelagibacterium limicola TaxID=2791022 RepID=UPI0018AFA8FB|nr:hypothetical protein [Pelagibacterium limicola]
MNEDRLRTDCARCIGLCCVLLAFDRRLSSEVEGFGGCMRYDCFGAGQAVMAMFEGLSWREGSETMRVMYDAFVVLRERNKAVRCRPEGRENRRG